jgi:hypothetical protein
MAEAPAAETPAAPAEAPATPPVPASELSDRAWLASAAQRLQDAAAEEVGETADAPEEAPDEAAEEPAGAEAEKPPAKDAKPADEKPKPEPKRKTIEVKPEQAADLEQLKALTKKLGLAFDGGKVSVQEQVAFREEKQKAKQRIAAAEAQVAQQIQQARAQLQAELAEVQAFKAARDSDDNEAVAKLLGHKDWNAYQEHLIKAHADPNYKALVELREKQARLEQERAQERQQAAAQREAYERQTAERQYVGQLQTQLKESPEKLCAVMHDDPLFVQAVKTIQGEIYQATRQVPPPEQAIIAQRRGPTLQDQMRGLYDKLHRVFGEEAPAEAEAEPEAPPAPPPPKVAKPGAKPAPRTAVVPVSKSAGEPSAKGKLSERDQMRDWTARLQRAARDEDTKRH